ncbi:MAG TPA: DUF5009 domain-containing protein [Candidatus Limnocylindria bacterium]|jgi:predicted acyltransferase|nr:DUF5009 domain-containing protein [Candidatus Limnocylindria bacterium]
MSGDNSKTDMNLETPPKAGPPPRLLSLDAYRGWIMLTLLCAGIFNSLKGHPTWNWLYVQTEHVEWEGCVYWDLIQPSFMFIVGVAMPLAFSRRAAAGNSWRQQFRHALFRAFTLMLIGTLLDHFGATTIQIGFIRVLQQIAIGYILVFFLLDRSPRVQATVAGVTLIAYQLAWMYNPWNGPGGPWAQGNQNIGSALDQWMLGRNYSNYYVGSNAIPASVMIFFGVMAGQLLQKNLAPKRIVRVLLISGCALLLAGYASGHWFPIIKRIWTPTFTLFAGGWSILFLATFYWLVDAIGWKKWAFPLIVVGANSMAAYFMANCLGGWFRSLTDVWIAGLRDPLGAEWFPVLQRLLFAASAWLVLYWLYRRRIFLKA